MSSDSSTVAKSFSVTEYTSKYTGYTKILRLIFIAEKFSALRQEALKLLLKDLKSSSNYSQYVKICKSFEFSGDPETALDENWVQITEQKVNAQLSRFEAELSTAKSTMVKESIRVGHNDIGNFFYSIGNLNEALKCYLRTRDFCSLPHHNSEMCLNIIGVSIDLNQFFNANNFLNKVTDTKGDNVLAGKLKAAAGLVFLHDGLFKAAALKFLEIDHELGNQYNATISDEDIGLYGTICALATFTRQELRKQFVEKKGFFNNYTSLIPELRVLALGFIHGKYESSLKTLETLRPRLLLDIHISKNAVSLINLISERLLVQYFSPYDVVDLTRMATALDMDYATLETQISTLISNDRLPGRIDSQHKTLHRVSEDSRQALVEKVLHLSKVHTQAVKNDMLRLSLLKHGFMVESAGGDQQISHVLRGSERGRVGGGGGERGHVYDRDDDGEDVMNNGDGFGGGGIGNVLGAAMNYFSAPAAGSGANAASSAGGGSPRNNNNTGSRGGDQNYGGMEVEDDFFSSSQQPEMMDRGVYGGHNRNQNRNNQRNENQHSSGSAGNYDRDDGMGFDGQEDRDDDSI